MSIDAPKSDSDGAPQANAVSPQPRLGDSLKRLRTSRSLALGHVAEATGISKSFLSLVEAGKSDISIGRLLRLADFFGVGLLDIVPGHADTDAQVVRRENREVLDSVSEHVRTYLLATDASGTVTSLLAVFEPGGRADEFRQHPGIEFVLVLEGRGAVHFDDGSETVLEEGDSVVFDPERSHSYSNAGAAKLTLLSISFANGA
jgi:transcriptional regulator with XRE-family HTH domain